MTDVSAHPLNPERAIWDKNLPELERALTAGWTLPRARSKEGGSVEDLSLAIRVVSLRWESGWRAMSDAFPHLSSHPVMWTLALRQAVPGVVSDMLSKGQSAVEPLDNGLLPLHVVMEAMGARPGEPIDENDLLETCRLLVAAGADPTAPHFADYTPGDNSRGGHSLWSRAMFFCRWEVARAFQPSSWQELLSLSRGLEMLNDLHRGFVSGRNPGALRMWTDLMDEWLGSWLESQPSELFAHPAELETLPSLSPQVRSHVWDRWGQVDNMGWTGLHELALSGKDPRAHRALALAVSENAPCLARWEYFDHDGMRPSDLWAIANGRDPQAIAPALHSLPELTVP